MRCSLAAAVLCAVVMMPVGKALAYWESVYKAGKAETCIASHYGKGDGYGGRKTASGAIMNPSAMTAAHKTRKFGSRVRVTNLKNGRSVIVTINDRGPFVKGRCIDLSYGAAKAIDMDGVAPVRVQ